MDEKEIQIGEYTAKVTIDPDDDARDPREDQDMGTIHVFHDGPGMAAKAKEIFGAKFGLYLETMKNGKVAWKGNTPWIGMERYSHGGDAYAPTRMGGFPDRRWDVTPLAGFWSPLADKNKKSALSRARAAKRRANAPVCPTCQTHNVAPETHCVECGCSVEWVRESALLQAENALRDEMRSDIKTWNMYVQGDIWRYSIELIDENGNEVDSDACCGFYGSDAAEEAANEIVEHWKTKYWKNAQTNENGENPEAEKPAMAANE